MPSQHASAEPQPPTVSGQANQTSKKKWWIIGGIILLVAIIAIATLYSSFLGAKVAPGKKFKVLGPSTLQVGKTATITWDVSTEMAKQYPFEKIEYCYGSILKRKCVVLAVSAPNNGKAVVKVPTSVPVGKGNLKFTARDPKKKLFSSLTATSGTVSVKPAAVVAVSNDGGGSGGGGGGGSSGGGGGSSNDGGGGGSTTLNIDQLALNNIATNDITINSFRVSFNTSLPTDQGDLYFRKKGTENWGIRLNEFLPTTSFSFVADNLESNTDYEYKVRGFRYKSQDCRIANCAYESKESDIRTIRTNQPSSPFELTYVRACFDRVPLSGSSSTYPIVLLAWESDQAIHDTKVHFFTRESGTTEWFDWWTIFSPNDPNYAISRFHYNGQNKQIRVDVPDWFKPNTSYEFQFKDDTGRELTQIIPFSTSNIPPTPSAGLSTCRDNIIHESGSAYNTGSHLVIFARNPQDFSNYKGYLSVNGINRQISLNPDPTKLVGTVARKYCGVITENDFAPLQTILNNLQANLPIRKTSLGLPRGTGKEMVTLYLSDFTSNELTGYGNIDTDFPTPLRELRTLLHQYAYDYCGTDLTFP